MRGRLFRSSSMAEHSAVNRRVVGSSPTCGAKARRGRREPNPAAFLLPIAYLPWRLTAHSVGHSNHSERRIKVTLHLELYLLIALDSRHLARLAR